MNINIMSFEKKRIIWKIINKLLNFEFSTIDIIYHL